MADPGYAKLPLPVQTVYARLQDLLLTTETGSAEPGTALVSKTIRGRRYWYAQRTEAGRKVQTYLGPETPEMQTTIERWRRGRSEAASRAELVAMARAGGAHMVGAAEADVLQRLAPAFRMGAVLVGSHAFLVLGNQLGVRWREAMARTEDVDIAQDRNIDLALAREGTRIDVQEALGAPVPRFSILNPTDPATVFRVRGTEIEVELLTPMVGRDQRRPVKLASLGAAATPLRFLDYLIEETQPGVVLGGAGVLVNVPRPGRFAFHKLIVAARRRPRASGATKAPKDRAQAEALFRVLLAEVPGEITLAWKALARRGSAWVGGVAESLGRLDEELVAELRKLGVRPGRSTRG